MAVNFGGNNPMEYLKKYAKDNNLNVQDAMSALQSQYGAPQMPQLQSTSIFDVAGGNNAIGGIQGGPQKPGDPQLMQGMQNGFMQNIMNIFKGGNGPQQEGDPQFLGDLTFSVAGPQKPGDFNPTQQGLAQNDGQSGMLNQDPDAVAQRYAEEKGISVEEAKAQLKAMFGDPQKQ